MSESSDTNINDDIQQKEQKVKQTYHDKNIEHIKRMSEKSKILKQQQQENEKQKPPTFKLHFNGANKDNKKESLVSSKLTQSKIKKSDVIEDKNNSAEPILEELEDNQINEEEKQLSSNVSEISDRPFVQYPRNVSLAESQMIFQNDNEQPEQKEENQIQLKEKVECDQNEEDKQKMENEIKENDNEQGNQTQEQNQQSENEEPPILFDGLEENSDENFGSGLVETAQDDQDYIQSDDLKLIKSEESLFVPETLLNFINSIEKLKSIQRPNQEDNNMESLKPKEQTHICQDEKCTELNLYDEGEIVENLSTSIQKGSSDQQQEASLPSNIIQNNESIKDPVQIERNDNANEVNIDQQATLQPHQFDNAELTIQSNAVESLKPQNQQTLGNTIQQPSLQTLKQSPYLTNINKKRVIATKLMESLKQKGISNVDQYVNSLDNEGKQNLINDIAKIEKDVTNQQSPVKKPHVKSLMQNCKSEKLPMSKLPQVLNTNPNNLPPRYKSTQVQDNMKQTRVLLIQIINCYTEQSGDKVNGITLPNLMCNNKVVPFHVFYQSISDQQKSLFVTNKVQHIDAVPTGNNRVYIAPAQMSENNQYFLRPHPSKPGLSQPKDVIIYDVVMSHSSVTDVKKLVQAYAFSKPGEKQNCLILRQCKVQLPRGTGLLIQDIEINLGEKIANSIATTAGALKASQSFSGNGLVKLENNNLRRSSVPILTQTKEMSKIGQQFETSVDFVVQMCVLETYGQTSSINVGNVQIMLQNDICVNVKSLEIVDTQLNNSEIIIKGNRQSQQHSIHNVEEGKGDLLIINRQGKQQTQYDGISINFKFDFTPDQMGQAVQYLVYKCSINGDIPKLCYFFVNGQPVSPLTCVQMSPIHALKQQILLKSSPKAMQQLLHKANLSDKPVQQYIWENLKKLQVQSLFQKKTQTVLNSYILQNGNRYFSIRLCVLTQHKSNHASTIHNLKVYNAFKEEISDVQVHESSKASNMLLDITIYRAEPMEFCMLQFTSRNCKTVVISMDRKLIFQGNISEIEPEVVSISLSKGIKGPGYDKILVQ